MNILLVTERFPPQRGGVGISAMRLAEGLAGHVTRFDVAHLTSDLAPGEVVQSEGRGYRVFSVGRAAREDESMQLLETVVHGLHARHRYSLLHGFYAAPTGAVAVLAARSLGLPSILSVRGNDVDRGIYQAGRGAVLIWALQAATRVVAVSSALARRVCVLAGRDDVRYVPNAVDPDLFRPEPRDERLLRHLDLPHHTALVAFSGEMRLKKGMYPLLSAVDALPGITLLLIGGVRKDERHAFEHWEAHSVSASARVREVPYDRDRDSLRALYNTADLLVFPSLWEGMPNGVLEAMACARPVLATGVGGMADVIEDGRNGFLIPLEQLEELPQRIMRVLEMPVATRDEVGQAGRLHVMAHHRPQQEVERFMEVYRAVTD